MTLTQAIALAGFAVVLFVLVLKMWGMQILGGRADEHASPYRDIGPDRPRRSKTEPGESGDGGSGGSD